MSTQLLHLSPEQIELGPNTRFNLKPAKIQELMESIQMEGQVLEPVLITPEKLLIAGFYRHAAVAALNKEGAGLTLPAIVIDRDDALARMKTQIAENNDREELSPMDRATAMKALLDSGVSRQDVRRTFQVAGGPKGNTLSPMSNALLNIYLKFLELPKTIQERIHDGRLGISAAYELSRVTPERRQAVLDRAEAARREQDAKETKEEELYLKREAAAKEAEEKAAELEKKVQESRDTTVGASRAIAAATEALRDVQKVDPTKLDETAKKEWKEKLAAAETNIKQAQKVEKQSKNETATLLTKSKKAIETAQELKDKLEALRKAQKASKKEKGKLGAAEIKGAAKAEGETSGHVSLGMADIREAIKEGASQTTYPRVAVIFKVFGEMIYGVHTTKETLSAMAVLTGENKQAQRPTRAVAVAAK